jgi:hypothetical protein
LISSRTITDHIEQLKTKFCISDSIVGHKFIGNLMYINMLRGIWEVPSEKYVTVNIAVDACSLNV